MRRSLQPQRRVQRDAPVPMYAAAVPSEVPQAEAAADRIAALKNVAAVYASPMERTRETAAPIAKARKLRVRQAKGLIECDFGDWTGKKLADLRKLDEWKTVQRYPSGFRFP
ncbi:MAG: histidine phosphatase family protein, partial [Pseudomonadota bacterium]